MKHIELYKCPMQNENALFIPPSGSRRKFSLAEPGSPVAIQSRPESDGARDHRSRYKHTPNPEISTPAATLCGRKLQITADKNAGNGPSRRVANSNVNQSTHTLNTP